jgi:hypothetical protein
MQLLLRRVWTQRDQTLCPLPFRMLPVLRNLPHSLSRMWRRLHPACNRNLLSLSKQLYYLPKCWRNQHLLCLLPRLHHQRWFHLLHDLYFPLRHLLKRSTHNLHELLPRLQLEQLCLCRSDFLCSDIRLRNMSSRLHALPRTVQPMRRKLCKMCCHNLHLYRMQKWVLS